MSLTPDHLFALANPLAMLGWALSRWAPRRAALLTGVGAARLAQALAGRPLLVF